MGPFERFLAGVAGAFAAIGAAADDPAPEAPADPPAMVEEARPSGAPDRTPPLPTPRPDPDAETEIAIALDDPEPEPDGPAAPEVNEDGIALADVAPEPAPADNADDPSFRFAVIEGPLAFAEPARPDFAAGPELAILPPPMPEPNPLAVGEIELAALPPVPFAPAAGAHDRACLSQLAALPLEATLLEPIVGAGACGVSTPLDVEAIGMGAFEVDLVPAAVVDCSVVGALTQWLEEDVQPAARLYLGQYVTGIRVAASYVCRTRNHVAGAPLSEHAFGNAIDISAFRLADGTWLYVEPRDPGTPAGQFQAAIRSEACGTFATVLGPGSDAFHDDHFHFDLAARRNQSTYCR